MLICRHSRRQMRRRRLRPPSGRICRSAHGSAWGSLHGGRTTPPSRVSFGCETVGDIALLDETDMSADPQALEPSLRRAGCSRFQLKRLRHQLLAEGAQVDADPSPESHAPLQEQLQQQPQLPRPPQPLPAPMPAPAPAPAPAPPQLARLFTGPTTHQLQQAQAVPVAAAVPVTPIWGVRSFTQLQQSKEQALALVCEQLNAARDQALQQRLSLTSPAAEQQWRQQQHTAQTSVVGSSFIYYSYALGPWPIRLLRQGSRSMSQEVDITSTNTCVRTPRCSSLVKCGTIVGFGSVVAERFWVWIQTPIESLRVYRGCLFCECSF